MNGYKVLRYTVEKMDGTYWMGQTIPLADVSESEAISFMKEYCQEKKYRLVLLIQVFPGLPIVNQIYPYESNDEVREYIGPLSEAAMRTW